jgi:hypothetical protein
MFAFMAGPKASTHASSLAVAQYKLSTGNWSTVLLDLRY